MFVVKTTSCPIPIPQGKSGRYQRHRLFPSPKNSSDSPLDKLYCDALSASAPAQATVAAHELVDYDDEVCAISCADLRSYLSKGRIHLVNSFTVHWESAKLERFYVLCDCPKIKTPQNRLSYSLLESKKGVLVFADKSHAKVLKDELDLPYHVVEVIKSDLLEYTNATKSSSVIVYNSYTDIETKTSYFLYFELNPEKDISS